jgi:D-arabinose 1-dehydrogenase-like Zn-dependent alcohol dehydrogenase
VIASASQSNHDYLREIGAIPVLYGAGLIDRVRAVPVDRIDAVLDVAGKTPIEDLIAIAPEPAQVVSIANFKADEAGARVTGGSSDSQPEKALAQAADLLQSGQLVIKVQTFPFPRAAEAYQQNQSGHIRGKVVLIPDH